MQEDLWGNEIELPPTPKKDSQIEAKSTALKLTSDDCAFFGHTWQPFGMQGEKKCSICGEIGYCPLCALVAPNNGVPYYCTKHTPKENKVVS